MLPSHQPVPYTHPLFSHRFNDSRTFSTVLDGLDAFLRDLNQPWIRWFTTHRSDTSYTYVAALTTGRLFAARLRRASVYDRGPSIL